VLARRGVAWNSPRQDGVGVVCQGEPAPIFMAA